MMFNIGLQVAFAIFYFAIVTTAGKAPKCDSSDDGPKSNGEEWQERSFIKKCSISGNMIRTTIVACMWGNPGEEIRISLGSDRVVGPQKIKCEDKGESGTGLSTEFIKCPVKNSLKSNGEEWQSGFLVYKCKIDAGAYDIEVLSCFYKSERIPIGGTEKVGDESVKCIKDGGSYRLKNSYEAASNGANQNNVLGSGSGRKNTCDSKNQGPKQNGEEWQEGSFIKKCSASGGVRHTTTLACMWGQRGQEVRIPRGSEQIIKGAQKVKCEATDTGTSLSSEFIKCPTGSSGVKSNGEEWQSSFLVYRCKLEKPIFKIEVLSCFWKQKSVRIPIGGSKKVGNKTAKCIKTGSGYRLEKPSAKY